MNSTQGERTDEMSRRRANWLSKFMLWLACLFFVWGLTSILGQYRWYFPPDFSASEFLVGRQATFYGLYQWAFYLHLISGPIAIVLAAILILSGGHANFRSPHRLLGKILFGVVFVGLLPSGLVMATQALTGPIAGWGFACLAVATAACTFQTAVQARRRRLAAHRRWALRSFILLCSPMLLRFVATALAGFEIESAWTYQLNAWLCWLLPILTFELVQSRLDKPKLASRMS